MKKYQKPIIYEIELDRDIVFMQSTQPEDWQVSSNSDEESTSKEEDSSTSSTKENNFDENPFER